VLGLQGALAIAVLGAVGLSSAKIRNLE
jgi:hypothetical protein